ncbi:MAG: hypothetical protein ACRDNT_02940 [Streptosporangiaceae bacterium]
MPSAAPRRCNADSTVCYEAGHRKPPSTGQVERVVASGCRQFDDGFAATTAGRLGPLACGRLGELLSRPNVLADLKSDPGPLGLDTLLAEISTLSTVRALGLDEAVFGATRPARTCRPTGSCRRPGGTASPTATAGWSGSRTNCAC